MDILQAITETHRRQRAALIEALGPTIMDAIADDAIVEITRNDDGSIWTERFGYWPEDTGTKMSDSKAELCLGLLASLHGTTIGREKPTLRAELLIEEAKTLDAYPRVQGVVRPVSPAPIFAIRKHSKNIPTLQDYINEKRMTPEQADAIREALRKRRNVLIVGGTSTGKTHLAKACIDAIVEIAPNDRLGILEDTNELTTRARNRFFLRATAEDGADRDAITIAKLVAHSKRLSPTRLIVGENRYGEDVDALLEAWRSGHPGGVCTAHANDAAGGLVALEQMLRKAGRDVDPGEIASTVNLVIFLERDLNSFRRVKEVLEVKGYHPESGYSLHNVSHPQEV